MLQTLPLRAAVAPEFVRGIVASKAPASSRLRSTQVFEAPERPRALYTSIFPEYRMGKAFEERVEAPPFVLKELPDRK